MGLGVSFATAFVLDVAKVVPEDIRGWLSVIGGVLIAVFLGLLIAHRRSDRTEGWFLGRAIAESSKTASWKYMMRVSPFQDDSNADARLRTVMLQVLGVVQGQGDRDLYREEDLSPTDEMRRVRSAPPVERLAMYLRLRLEDQIRWYADKSAIAHRNSDRAFALAVVAQFVAIGLLVVRFLRLFELEAVATFSTLGASLIGWSEAERYDELASSYALAANELRQIRAHQLAEESESDVARLVMDAEGAISREHTTWIAKTPAVSRTPTGRLDME